MMVVASPRATMASQLKKGTVQLNVLQREEKKRDRKHQETWRNMQRGAESQRGHFNSFLKQSKLIRLPPAIQIHHTQWNFAGGNNFTRSLRG